MDGGVAVVLISAAMFIGCFLLGFIPLLITLSEWRLRLISVLGAGLLCGTALAIIIPEGVVLLVEPQRGRFCSSVSSNHNASEAEEPPPERGLQPRFLIGLALVSGFTFMFVVDQIGSNCSLQDQRTGLPGSTRITATLGLVIHAAADGCALGAAMASPAVSVQVLVFLAVILHKAPAAFGLVSFLMNAGLEKKQIQGHLLAFSAAAPLLAISTYFILTATEGSAQSRLVATGVGMLFSAGTFLYVATVHVLPEVSSRGQHRPPHLHHHTGPLGAMESITLTLGAGLPVLLALGLQDD